MTINGVCARPGGCTEGCADNVCLVPKALAGKFTLAKRFSQPATSRVGLDFWTNVLRENDLRVVADLLCKLPTINPEETP